MKLDPESRNWFGLAKGSQERASILPDRFLHYILRQSNNLGYRAEMMLGSCEKWKRRCGIADEGAFYTLIPAVDFAAKATEDARNRTTTLLNQIELGDETQKGSSRTRPTPAPPQEQRSPVQPELQP